jgi:hypothetical protein
MSSPAIATSLDVVHMRFIAWWRHASRVTLRRYGFCPTQFTQCPSGILGLISFNDLTSARARESLARALCALLNNSDGHAPPTAGTAREFTRDFSSSVDVALVIYSISAGGVTPYRRRRTETNSVTEPGSKIRCILQCTRTPSDESRAQTIGITIGDTPSMLIASE